MSLAVVSTSSGKSWVGKTSFCLLVYMRNGTFWEVLLVRKQDNTMRHVWNSQQPTEHLSYAFITVSAKLRAYCISKAVCSWSLKWLIAWRFSSWTDRHVWRSTVRMCRLDWDCQGTCISLRPLRIMLTDDIIDITFQNLENVSLTVRAYIFARHPYFKCHNQCRSCASHVIMVTSGHV